MSAVAIAPRSEASAASTVECLLALVYVKWSLKVRGLERTVAWARAERSRAATEVTEKQLSTTAHNIAAASAFLPLRAYCLEQSLALCRVLNQHGIEATLCFGVQPYGFTAHAWVEHDDRPVNDVGELLRHVIRLPDLPR